MKILALEHEIPGTTPGDFQEFTRAEAACVWELYQQGFVRELYFRADRSEAVLVLEAEDVESARQGLATLPLVEYGFIVFELIPLVAYPGFERLFAPPQPGAS
jgi:muconolactone delta-isomerase